MTTPLHDTLVMLTCPACSGSGCRACNGTGRVPRDPYRLDGGEQGEDFEPSRYAGTAAEPFAKAFGAWRDDMARVRELAARTPNDAELGAAVRALIGGES
ncbi:MAG: hypothetical protein IPJ65_42945 [Archangiaceae bacterium]|nr:hypothetical protein [Archangiaceae bacterium]